MEQEKFPNAPAYNPEKVEKFRNLLEEIKDKAVAKDTKDLTGLMEFLDSLVIKARDLEKKYPNTIRYAMFHVLSGSTIPSKLPPLLDDFPGEDSVEKFIYSLQEKYK